MTKKEIEASNRYFMQGITVGTLQAVWHLVGCRNGDEGGRFIGAYLRVFKEYYETDPRPHVPDLGKKAFAAGRRAMWAYRRSLKA